MLAWIRTHTWTGNTGLYEDRSVIRRDADYKITQGLIEELPNESPAHSLPDEG